MDELDQITEQLVDKPNKPPVHLWHPELSGDIDIVIKANGDWYHNGGLIRRKPLVKLFASILRKEQDNHYYLVTPVEKWRIRVEDTPLIIVAMDILHAGATNQQIVFTTNVDDKYLLGHNYPLTVVTDPGTGEPHPTVALDNKLTAKVNRPVFYQLTDHSLNEGENYTVMSDGCSFVLGKT